MSGTARPKGLHEQHRYNGLCQETGENELVEAFMRVADTAEVVAHLEFLVIRAGEEIREATSREVAPDFGLGWYSRRTTDSSDIGTCEIMRSGERLLLLPVYGFQGGIKSHTYRMRGN